MRIYKNKYKDIINTNVYILFKICLSARIRRDGGLINLADFVKTRDLTSSEEATLSKYLGLHDKTDFSKILSDIKSAKSVDAQLDGYVRI